MAPADPGGSHCRRSGIRVEEGSEQDDPTQVPALVHVGESLCDVVELVGGRDQLVELQRSRGVQSINHGMSAVGADAPNREPWIRFWYSTNSMGLMGIPKSVIDRVR